MTITKIIPRWEWRTFGRPPAAAQAVFDAADASPVAESDETYLLGPLPDANVKVRDDLLDIKVLREVDEDGLERWEPVLKRPFPLSPAEVDEAWRTIGLPGPSGAEAPSTFADLVALLEGSGQVRAVAVHKRRLRYTIGGCMAERSELTADGRTSTTVAVESTDARAVVAAVASLSLADYRNIDYQEGLAELLEDRNPRYAVIDAGTNSIKFHMGELEADGSWRTVADRAAIVRLGEGVDHRGRISGEAEARAVEAIAGMADEAARADSLAIAAVGTEVFRQATNASEVIEAIRTRTGVRIQPLSGEEEGRLAYVAVRAGLGRVTGSLVVFDTGGGSSQFTFGSGTTVDERFSVPVGAVRFTERFGLDHETSAATLADAMTAIAADLSRLDGRPSPDTLVGMGGAITNLTAVMHGMATYDPERVQGSILTAAEIDRQIELYRSRDADGRRSIVGLQPKRAEVILAGACIVRTVMSMLDKEELTVSDRGLRHGLLAERFGPQEGPP